MNWFLVWKGEKGRFVFRRFVDGIVYFDIISFLFYVFFLGSLRSFGLGILLIWRRRSRFSWLLRISR